MSASAPVITDEKGRRELVKDLAEAVSTQAEVANRTWLALITVAMVAIIHHPLKDTLKDIPLPFGLEGVSPFWFHGVVLSFLVVLAIAFAAAHSHQVRAQKLAHDIITSLGPALGPVCAVHPRDYFDMYRKPSLIRIASLAQSLRGKYQFFTTAAGLPNWRRQITVWLYWLWKIIGLGIYFVVPIVALCLAHRDFSAPPCSLLNAFNLLFTIVAVCALGQVLWQDFVYAIEISKDC
jgi:hypothetical protein